MAIKIQNVVILRSSDLLHRKGKSEASGYKYSRHQEGLANVEQALKDISVPYEYLEEDDFRSAEEMIGKNSPRIIIVPEMRTCGGDTFQKLKDYAEKGWIVFAIFDSFYFKSREGKDPERVVSSRMKDLFQLSNFDIAETESDLQEAEISFSNGRYSWLTEGLQPTMRFHENMVVGVVAKSSVLVRHGDVKAIKVTKDTGGKERRVSRSYPAFLIREFDSGGLFIYSAFLLRKIENYQLVYRNLYRHKTLGKNTTQVRILTWVVVAEAVIIGFLIAKEFMNIGNLWATQIGTALIGGVVGWLVTKATNFFDKFLKDS